MKIAFLEDDPEYAQQIRAVLTEKGHDVSHFDSGRACASALSEEQFDIALLDWEVPDMSGVEVLANLKLKGQYPPVIFLTGRDAEEDIVKVINAGADDYVVKPVNDQILLARLDALYRRNHQASTETSIAYGDLTIDTKKRQFVRDGQPIKLTEKETDLALYFFSQIGVLLSRAHLTKVVWGTSPDIDTRTIDVHVSHLRTKLSLMPENGWKLVSVYHQGYRLEYLD